MSLHKQDHKHINSSACMTCYEQANSEGLEFPTLFDVSLTVGIFYGFVFLVKNIEALLTITRWFLSLFPLALFFAVSTFVLKAYASDFGDNPISIPDISSSKDMLENFWFNLAAKPIWIIGAGLMLGCMIAGYFWR